MSVFNDMGPPNDNGDDPKPTQDTNPRNSAKTFQQWQDLRRSNPHKYFSPEGQKRLQKDALTLGRSAFFCKDGDTDDWWSK